jgi:hypothetical protein
MGVCRLILLRVPRLGLLQPKALAQGWLLLLMSSSNCPTILEVDVVARQRRCLKSVCNTYTQDPSKRTAACVVATVAT